ncbi:MAG: methyltransferase domain-containing protein [Betaproteobacteria bacterium]|nr:methyltransferase domain-containing protein [Betaproteobacteria bacterium]
MSLKATYTLLAPFYDLVVRHALDNARRASLAQLPREGGATVFINGIGTGLDIPYLPPGHRYVGLDLTRSMLERARCRVSGADLVITQGDSLKLPFKDACFNHAALHLILAVVPEPTQALAETARVVTRGGLVLVLDKFLRPGQRAPLRRLLNPIARRIATRLDVVFEEVLARVPGLALESDQPALAGGWFRIIRLRKK